jgi:hypothetical protein
MLCRYARVTPVSLVKRLDGLGAEPKLLLVALVRSSDDADGWPSAVVN